MIEYTSTRNIFAEGSKTHQGASPPMERLRRLFLEGAPASREDERWMSITARSKRQGLASMLVLEFPGLGIAFRLRIDRVDCKPQAWVSVGNPNKLGEVFDARDGEYASRGMFLPVEKAWLAVEDFMTDPFEKSPRIEWEDEERYPGVPDWML